MAGGWSRVFSSASACHLPFVPGSRRRLLRLCALVIAAAGVAAGGSACAPGTPAPERPRPSPPPSEAVVDSPSVSAPWVVRRTGASHEHRIIVSATLESRVDTVVRFDSVRSELLATWRGPTSSSGWPRGLIGTVDAYAVAAGGDSLVAVAGLQLPLSFAASQRSAQVQPEFSAPDAASCASIAGGIVQGVRDLWLSLPDTLRAGATWRDSAAYVVCRDSIPLALTVVRTFEVGRAASIGAEGLVITIMRRTVSQLRGSGTQFGEPVTIEGRGEGMMIYEVGLSGARVRGATGDAVLTLTLRGSRRVQELTQRSRTEILER